MFRLRVAGRATKWVLVAIIGWALFLAAHVLLSGRWWLWGLVELAPPAVALGVPLGLLALAGLATGRARLLAVAAATGLVLAGLPLSGVVVGTGKASLAAAAAGIRVFSWNTQRWHQDDDSRRFYDYLRGQRADVYLLQEYLHYGTEAIKIDDYGRLRAEFPGYTVIVASELVTITRLPVVRTAPIDASRFMSGAGAPPQRAPWRDYWTTKVLRTDVQVGGQVVSFYNAHIAVQVDILSHPFAARFYRNLHHQYQRRQAGIRALRAELAGNRQPLVLAGDFNTTSWMGDLGRFGSGLRQVKPVAASFPTTWPTRDLPLPRLWRLDWVFVRGNLAGSQYQFRPSRQLSDHLAQEFVVTLR